LQVDWNVIQRVVCHLDCGCSTVLPVMMVAIRHGVRGEQARMKKSISYSKSGEPLGSP
jgi:hypothetical protein